MNKIINTFLLVGDKFLSEMRLENHRFTFSVGWSFTINKERIQKVKETGDSRYIYQNELYKVYF